VPSEAIGTDTLVRQWLAWLPGSMRPTTSGLNESRSVSPGLSTPGTVPPLVYCQNVQADQPAGIGGRANPYAATHIGSAPNAVDPPVQVSHQFAVV
jgi:hypothetical protein